MEWLQPKHADDMDSPTQLRQDRGFSDFTLHLKEGPLLFSRFLLGSMSLFFHKLMTVDMKESRSSEVHMEHVTQDTWNCITSFYFSSSKLISIHNVLDVLVTSHMYGLEELVQYCSEFLLSHCCAENCLSLLKIAKQFELESLVQEARRIFTDDFSTVCKCEQFLSLEKAELLELLEEEVVTTEDDLCQALLAWMEKKNADAATCTEVFQQLYLNLISDEFLESRVMCHSQCISSTSIHSLVTQETMRRTHSTSKRQLQVKARKRRPCSAKNSLFVIGVNSLGNLLVFVWSFVERRWTQFYAPSFVDGVNFSCATLEDTVIVTGGSKSQRSYLFDLGTLTWSRGPHLLQGRKLPGMTTIGHTAYVVGGRDVNSSRLSSIEEYSKASRQWTPTGCLQEATVKCGVAALGDTILVVGGNMSAQFVQTFNVLTRSAAVLNVQLPRDMLQVIAASNRTSAFFVGEEGHLVQVRKVKGKLNTSCEVLESFFPNNVSLGLHASNSYVRVIGGSIVQPASCWDFTGEAIMNDDVENVPEMLLSCCALEVNIPSH